MITKFLFKKVGYILAILAIAAIVAWNANVSSKGDVLSDLSLANVEALAGGEDDEDDCAPGAYFDEYYNCWLMIWCDYAHDPNEPLQRCTKYSPGSTCFMLAEG